MDLFPTSSSKTIDPCITIINDYFAVVKDEFVIAVESKAPVPTDATGNPKITKEQVVAAAVQDDGNKPFKSLAWSSPIHQLGKPSDLDINVCRKLKHYFQPFLFSLQ